MTILFTALMFSYFVLIWFRTNAVVEYLNLLNVTYFFKIDEYNKLHADGFEDNYISFLNQYYRDLFIVRLLSCPVCICFWLGVLSAAVNFDFYYVIVAPLSLLFYLLFNKML